jgi:hypothetical protein
LTTCDEKNIGLVLLTDALNNEDGNVLYAKPLDILDSQGIKDTLNSLSEQEVLLRSFEERRKN